MDSSLIRIVKSRWRGRLTAWICLGISLGLLALLLWLVDLRMVGAAIRGIRIPLFAASVGVAVLLPVFSTFRWLAALKGVGMNISFGKALPVVMSSFVINALVPSKGGDLLKAVFLRKEGFFGTLVGSVIIERYIDVLVLASIATTGAAVLGETKLLLAAAAVMAMILGLGFLLFVWSPAFLLRGKIGEKVGCVRDAFRQMGQNFGRILETAFWSLMVWSSAVLQATLVIWSLGGEIGLTHVAAVLPLALFIGMLPLSISGIGTRDGALLMLLGGVLAKPVIVAAGLLYTFNAYWFLALIGVPFFSVSLSRAVAEEEGLTDAAPDVANTF